MTGKKTLDEQHCVLIMWAFEINTFGTIWSGSEIDSLKANLSREFVI